MTNGRWRAKVQIGPCVSQLHHDLDREVFDRAEDRINYAKR